MELREFTEIRIFFEKKGEDNRPFVLEVDYKGQYNVEELATINPWVLAPELKPLLDKIEEHIRQSH